MLLLGPTLNESIVLWPTKLLRSAGFSPFSTKSVAQAHLHQLSGVTMSTHSLTATQFVEEHDIYFIHDEVLDKSLEVQQVPNINHLLMDNPKPYQRPNSLSRVTKSMPFLHRLV